MNLSPSPKPCSRPSRWTLLSSSTTPVTPVDCDHKGGASLHDATAVLARAIQLAFSETYPLCVDVPDPDQASKRLIARLDMTTGHLDLTDIAADKTLTHLVEHLTAGCWLALGAVASACGAPLQSVSLPAGGLGPVAMPHFAQVPGLESIRLHGQYGADLSDLAVPYADMAGSFQC